MMIVADFEDRVLLAHEYLSKRYEQRGNFLSDSDVMDAADLFTVDVRADADSDDLWVTTGVDHDALLYRLFADLEGTAT